MGYQTFNFLLISRHIHTIIAGDAICDAQYRTRVKVPRVTCAADWLGILDSSLGRESVTREIRELGSRKPEN